MKKYILVFTCFFLLKVSGQNLSIKVDSLMNYAVQQFNFSGVVLIAQKNHILYEKPYGKANVEWNIHHANETKFRLGSISKQFTAFIILQLCEQRKLSLDAKASKYIGALNDIENNNITIQNL